MLRRAPSFRIAQSVEWDAVVRDVRPHFEPAGVRAALDKIPPPDGQTQCKRQLWADVLALPRALGAGVVPPWPSLSAERAATKQDRPAGEAVVASQASPQVGILTVPV